MEGNPFDRPVYYYQQPAGLSGIFKKGINPKAKAILEDLIGKNASDSYHAEQAMLAKEREAENTTSEKKTDEK